MWNLRGGLSEESDRDERVKLRTCTKSCCHLAAALLI